MKDKKDVIVIGGGISGLSAAFYLQKLANERAESIAITILEQSDQIGGKVQTLREDGFIIERGPDSFLARKTPMIDLAKDLGLLGELVPTNAAARKTYIVHNNLLHPMPAGLILGIPTDLEALDASQLLSAEGKARVKLDLGLPRDAAKRRNKG